MAGAEFSENKTALKSENQIIWLEQLQSWTLQSYRNLESKLAERKQQAYMREYHGDLHLGNIALIDNEVTILDLQAPVDELRKRVEDRWRAHQDPSEENIEVLEAQLCHHQALTACELVNSLAANTNNRKFSKTFDAVRKKMI